MNPACTFCAIVAGMVPAERVAETERALAFVNINPANPGHMLVIPKHHLDGKAIRSSRIGGI